MKRPNWQETQAQAAQETNYPYNANAIQVGGDHYKGVSQTWDYIIEHDLGYLEGNIVKYVTRHKKKGGVQDLKKAMHYLQKLIEVEEAKLG